jgi:uncharacterized protein YdcH (DUF465 family)
MEMKNKMKKIMKWSFIVLFVLLIGVIIFLFVRSLYCANWFNSFTYDLDVSPFDVFNLIISSLVAISLGYYITKKLTEERFMKEFIIGDIAKVELELENIESILSANNVELSTIFNALNKLSHKIERIENTAKLIEFKSDEIKNLKLLYFQIFKIATNTDNSTRVNTIISNIELEPVYNDFSISLRKMVYMVNKI